MFASTLPIGNLIPTYDRITIASMQERERESERKKRCRHIENLGTNRARNKQATLEPNKSQVRPTKALS